MDTPQALADFSAGHAAFWMQHESLVPQINQDKPAGLDLDVMLMPKLVTADVKSQYPGGPAPSSRSTPRAIPTVRPQRLLSPSLSRRTPPTKRRSSSATAPCRSTRGEADWRRRSREAGLAITEFVTYLDWNWPPEITRSFQEGIQGGIAGQVSAADAAEAAQKTLERLVANGYKFLL